MGDETMTTATAGARVIVRYGTTLRMEGDTKGFVDVITRISSRNADGRLVWEYRIQDVRTKGEGQPCTVITRDEFDARVRDGRITIVDR